jgi:diaminohydroxyphosphoribosylaminopyrimidine deaminase / 5-amino-6-(5-phosphoribosylamino)uracil reductase
MEPCAARASRPVPCAQRLVEAGVSRVVYAVGEPETFVAAPGGRRLLREAGVVVDVLADFAAAASEPNSHLG